MTKRTRLIILFACIASFLIITPNLVLYSMGYRLDLKTMKITATGGIYVRTFPTAERITIDSTSPLRPGLFSNSIFVQNLIPAGHSVLVQKSGYFDYEKTISVQENQVTKLENILLIKRNIVFQEIIEDVDYFSVAPDKQNTLTATEESKNIFFNYFPLSSSDQPQTFFIMRSGLISDVKWSNDSLFALIKIKSASAIYYYLFDTTIQPQASPSQAQQQSLTVKPLSFLDKNVQQVYFNPRNSKEIFYIKNNILYSTADDKTIPIITGTAGYNFSEENIVWLSLEGLLYESDLSGKTVSPLTKKGVSIKSGQSLEISVISNEIFVHTDNSLLLLNSDTKTFENLPLPAGSYDILLSPDQENLAFRNGKEIYLYSFKDDVYENIFSGDSLTSYQWLNDDYIIFTAGDKIIISEIDYRGNINTITLPQIITLQPDKEIGVLKPKTFFNQRDGKVYFLTNKTLISSEKILPQ